MRHNPTTAQTLWIEKLIEHNWKFLGEQPRVRDKSVYSETIVFKFDQAKFLQGATFGSKGSSGSEYLRLFVLNMWGKNPLFMYIKKKQNSAFIFFIYYS